MVTAQHTRMYSKPIPLERYNCFSSSRVEEVRKVVTHSYCPHDLELARFDNRLKAHYNSFRLRGMSLNFLSYGADIEIVPGTFQAFYMLEFPLSGSVSLEYGQSRYKTQPGLGTLISPHEAVRSRWSADCEQVMVKIDRKSLEGYLSQEAKIILTEPLEFEPLIDFTSAKGELIKDFILMLLKQADSCPDLIARKQVAIELERVFSALILNNLDHNYRQQLAIAERPIVPKIVSRAQKFIEDNFAECVTLEDIVEASGCSERALYSAFKQFLGITPLNYLKNVRFENVRAGLQQAGNKGKVSEIAYQNGFTHMGRFSAEYIQRYNEKPSDTLRFS
ncbi:MAG: AraC family transcriptional regulator [Pseudomonadales bacterium]|nr:AraC family transcriptional regulator [Pseudomonadales bacterium]MCP5213511.1 AraC family transcriptional regulator [Pseudomonadales bacterium]